MTFGQIRAPCRKTFTPEVQMISASCFYIEVYPLTENEWLNIRCSIVWIRVLHALESTVRDRIGQKRVIVRKRGRHVRDSGDMCRRHPSLWRLEIVQAVWYVVELRQFHPSGNLASLYEELNPFFPGTWRQ